MKAKLESAQLPTVQEMIVKCDNQSLESEVLLKFARKSERVKSIVSRAISEMKGLQCHSLCSGNIPGQRSVIVVPRQRFITLGNNIYIRGVQAEYFNAVSPRILTSAVYGQSWQTVLQYGVWDRARLCAKDMQRLIADVCFSMLMCGSSASAAQSFNYLNLNKEGGDVRWQTVKKDSYGYCGNSSKEGGDANCNQDVWGNSYSTLEGNIVANFEQAAVTLGWLKIMNDRADGLFITEAKRLQEYLESVA